MGFSVNRRNSLRPPACAGKGSSAASRWPGGWDHPRVCGEKSLSSTYFLITLGSPPRVRGKGGGGQNQVSRAGITPACAGKSACGCTSRCRCWDHPRVCGEKQKFLLRIRTFQGSPPRVRGKGVELEQRGGSNGITPACAGKSSLVRRPVPLHWDHPRVCGEKT